MGTWPIAGLAGIQPDPAVPGFKVFHLKPGLLGTGVKRVHASYDSPYGPIRVRWELKASRLSANATVPPNTTALLHLPAKRTGDIREGGKTLEKAQGVKVPTPHHNFQILRLEPGTYQFEVPYSGE